MSHDPRSPLPDRPAPSPAPLAAAVRRLAWVGWACIALLASPWALASGGGGGWVESVSTPRVRPEPDAIKGYLDGHLGILWPSYDRAFLMMAYRRALGLQPLSAADTARLLSTKDGAEAIVGGPDFGIDAIAAWKNARKALDLPEPAYPLSSGWRDQGNYSSTANCLPAAFTMAAKTLADRLRDHGADAAGREAVRQWVAGQDSVFSACDAGVGQKHLVDPPDLPESAPRWLRRDRAYQAAARLLYLDQLDEAATAFDAIAADAGSPWREWAAYLAVRCWRRQSFKAPEDYQRFKTEVPVLAQHPMVVRLRRLQASAKDAAVRQAAEGLIESLATRYAPKEAHASLWRRMGAGEPVADIAAWVADERWLWAFLKPGDLRDDWLYATRSQAADDDGAATGTGDPPPLAGMAGRWRQHQDDAKLGPLWLASALMSATPETAGLDDLLRASQAAVPGEPLYIHFAWHRARLAIARRDLPAAREELERSRPALPGESLGTRQAFDQLEMILAPSLDALAGHLVRRAVASEGYDYDAGWHSSTADPSDPAAPPSLLDADTRQWMVTHLDGQELLSLARDERLPATVRTAIAGEAWRRGALLSDAAVELPAARAWAALAGEKEVVAAASPEELRFLMARLLLLQKVPRLRGGEWGMVALGYAPPPSQPPKSTRHWDIAPAFHDEPATVRQGQEAARLGASNETTWMGQQLLPWMRDHPRFAEGPAILEKLVYASRYGMRDTATSRQAFRLLHLQYPNSAEAVRTRYFY